MTDGWSISELALIFGKDRRTVTQRLRDCKASGERRGHPVYDLSEACRYLTFPMFDIEAYLRQADPKSVPPLLFKEYWAGQVSQQKFENNEANLWPTADVKAIFASVFKKLETGIRSFAGTIDSATALTDKQRQLLHELSHGLFVELHRTLVQCDIDAQVKPVRRRAEDVLELVEDDGL